MSIQLATIVLQSLVCLISLYAGLRGRKLFFGFFTAFGIYDFYNLSNLYGWHFKFLGQGSTDTLLLIASVGVLWSVWKVYRW